MASDAAGSTGGEIVLVGCGRLGSAILEGWLASGAVVPAGLIVVTPSPKPVANRAALAGARINAPPGDLAEADAVVLALKPAVWREALAPLAAHLRADAVIISVMAGVKADLIAEASGRAVARVMPTTAVAQARGVAAVWSADDRAREAARALFGPLAELVDLPDESLMDAATATAGSAPAFIHAFVQALATAGEAQGLSNDAATRLARGALRSAAAGLETGETLDALIGRVASPGGTTRAGLDAMTNDGALVDVARRAIDAAVMRAKAL